MTVRLRWTEQAVEQLGAVVDYVSQTSPVYADGLVSRVAAHVQALLDFPEVGRLVPEAGMPNVREVVEWPYRIIYRVRPETIDVIAIVHVRRDMRAMPLG
ncbi:MAG: type II toxin-antitoxin system RelE/ParE family toxin [Gemmatimonadota bacterium]|nr:type II toxin-antitoxin system RelE/ParE family toxin [Gemmatimonadota bacterium]